MPGHKSWVQLVAEEEKGIYVTLIGTEITIIVFVNT